MNGKLKLEGLLENFDAIRTGNYSVIEQEIETDEGEFIFVDISVDVTVSWGEVLAFFCEVNCYPEYFVLDRWGEEKECILDDEDRRDIQNEISEQIKDKLK